MFTTSFLLLVQEEFTVRVTYPVHPTPCSSVTWKFRILISNTVYNGAHAPNTSFIHSALFFFCQRKAQTEVGTWLLHGYNTVTGTGFVREKIKQVESC